MASENHDISDIVKKCKFLLLDVEGTTTSITFVKDKLFPYALENVKKYLEEFWENNDVKETVDGLRKLAIEDQDKNVEGVVTIPGEDAGKDEQIEGVVNSVKWLMSASRKVIPLKQLQGLIWHRGYDKGDIKGHVYDDVPSALQLWCSTEGQKVYIYSSGSVQAQKLLFNYSITGNLTPHIEGYFDLAVGSKIEAASYAAIAEKIGSKPEEILFLTDIVQEAEAARSSGLQAALMSREGNAPLPEEATSTFPVLHSMDQLTVSNKRKPDPQEEEVPAKVPKTDIEADVKSASEMEATDTTPETNLTTVKVASAETVAMPSNGTSHIAVEEPEKMDVEEELPVAETTTVTDQVEKVAEKPEEAPVRVVTSIEEDTSDKADNAMESDARPVIEESVEKTEKNETEKMETKPTENSETANEPKESPQETIEAQSAPVAEEKPASVITVQDVTNDQESISEGTEVVDIEPVVEEPPVEMEDLKNVGDVLEKECDEILSKVQDVTNLDNIPMKPLLNSISEETIEPENGQNTNDIVDSILDSEMELAAKPCDIDVNTVQEITDAPADIVEEELKEVPSAEGLPEEIKPAEIVVEKNAEEKEQENKVLDSLVENKEEKVEVSAAETVAEKTKEVEVKESAAVTEVTNGNAEENKPAPVEENIEADSVSETVLVPDIVSESKGSKDVNLEVVETNQTKDSPVEQDDNKMEAEESAAVLKKKTETKKEPVDKKTEITESIAEPVESKMEIAENISKPEEAKPETTESVAEPVVEKKLESMETTTEAVENKAETTETIAGPVENNAETTESSAELVEKKAETTESSAELVEKKAETTESIAESVENKSEKRETIAKPVEDKVETKEIIAEPVENKPETKESVVQPAENKPETNETIANPADSAMETESTPQPVEDQKKSGDSPVDTVENKSETKVTTPEQVEKMETEDTAMETEESTDKPVDNKMEDESTPQDNKMEDVTVPVPDNKVNESADKKETPEIIVTSESSESQNGVPMETEPIDKQVNGKTNGEAVNLNGDASKNEELTARLSVENGENSKEMNGANGNRDSGEEKGQGDNKVETEIPDIKVKTVATEESRSDPIEQPVEA